MLFGDLKTRVLRRFPIDKPDFEITHGLIFKRFENLEFRKILKSSCHSISIDPRPHNGERNPIFSFGNTRLSLVFKRMQKYGH